MNKSGRHVKTSELLPPPNMGMALGFGAAAAVAGAAAWALLIVFAHREFGYLAWGIGALVGFAVVKGGGHGQMLAVCAAVLSVLSIGTGKHFAYQDDFNAGVEDAMKHATAELHAEYLQDAKDWVALGATPSDDQVASFALDHDYEVDDANQFRRDWAPMLQDIAKNPPSFEAWRNEQREMIKANAALDYGFIDYLKADFSPIDIIFVLLGLGSAYSLVMRHTTTMQVAVRQQLRAEREAEEAADDQAEERSN